MVTLVNWLQIWGYYLLCWGPLGSNTSTVYGEVGVYKAATACICESGYNELLGDGGITIGSQQP